MMTNQDSKFVKIFTIILAVFCGLELFWSDSFAVADKDGPKIGDVPPPLRLTKTLQGSPAMEISWDKLKEKVVVLEFWATSCSPCIKAMPHLNDLALQFKNKPIVFISVTSENEGVVRIFLEHHPMKTWVGLDDYEVLNKSFHVDGIPHAVIVDATGHIAAIAHPADIKPENLEEILAGKKPSLPEPQDSIPENSGDKVVSNQTLALFEISIREHKMATIQSPTEIFGVDSNRCNITLKIAPVKAALEDVFDKSSCRIAIHCQLPDGYYDFELRAPPGRSNELENAFIAVLRATFGLEVRRATQLTDVYVLTQISTNAPGLRPVDKTGGGGKNGIGEFGLDASGMKGIADRLELALRKPVFDGTDLQGLFDVDMKWKLSEAEQLLAGSDKRVLKALHGNLKGDWISSLPEELRTGTALEANKRLQAEFAKPEDQRFRPDPDAVIAAARERLGLQLTLVQRPVEILQVSKASQ